MTLYAKFEKAAKIGTMSDTVYGVYSQGTSKWQGAPSKLDDIGAVTFADPVKAEDGGYTIAVSGTLKRVVGFTGFNVSVSEEQHGFYAPCQFSVGDAAESPAFVVLKAKEGYKVYSNTQADNNSLDEETTAAIKKAVGATEEDSLFPFNLAATLDADGSGKVFSLISHLGDAETLKSNTIWVGLNGVDDLKKYTFDYSGCNKWETALDFSMINAQNGAEILGSDGFAGATSENVEKFVNGDITFEQNDKEYNITGTLNYVKWDGFGVDGQKEGYYIPFAVKVPEAYKGKGKMVFMASEEGQSPEKINELGSNEEYFGWFIYIGGENDSLKKTRTVEITWGSGDDALTCEYTFNFNMQGAKKPETVPEIKKEGQSSQAAASSQQAETSQNGESSQNDGNSQNGEISQNDGNSQNDENCQNSESSQNDENSQDSENS